MSEAMTFHVARDAASSRFSHSNCASPSTRDAASMLGCMPSEFGPR